MTSLHRPAWTHTSRVRDPAFAIQHCYEEGFRYTHGYGPNRKWVPPWDRDFVGTAVEVRDTGPPSWIEEIRVMRALWLIQLVGDVRRLATKGDNVLGWPHEDVERMSRIEREDLTGITGLPSYCTGVRRWELLRLFRRAWGTKDEACKCMCLRRPVLQTASSPKEAVDTAWTTQEPGACIMSGGDFGFMYDYGNKVIQTEPAPEIRECHPFPQASKSKYLGQTRNALQSESPGPFFFKFL
jgi:hypothetical protein